MNTTTFLLIRDQVIAKVDALTPTKLAHLKFRRCPERRVSLRDWAREIPASNVVRRYDCRAVEFLPDPELMDPAARREEAQALLTVAYPTEPGIYGVTDLDWLDDAMESDWLQIHDTVFGANNYVSGQQAAFPTRRIDRGDSAVWFLDVTVRLLYDVAMSLP